MEDNSQEEVLPASLKKLNSGRKRKTDTDCWKDIKTKKLKDAGKTQGKQTDAKYPSKQVK
jgi:hypothetical protein